VLGLSGGKNDVTQEVMHCTSLFITEAAVI